MKPYIRTGNKKNPTVSFNCETGILEIKGNSIPENPLELYNPMQEWVMEYSKSPCEETELIFKLEYFNTSSSKAIMEIMKMLERIYKSGNLVSISWYYEEDDIDMKESGEDYESLISVPFKLIKY